MSRFYKACALGLLLVVCLMAAVAGYITFSLGTTPSNPAAGKIRIWANTATGNLECINSSGTECKFGVTTTYTIASGAKALATTAIASAACSAAQTDTATGTATTDTIIATFNADPTAVTGYVPLTTGMLTIIAYPTTNTVNFKICNNTSSSITPGAITLNWRVVR